MKIKIFILIVIVGIAIGVGWFLFKEKPQEQVEVTTQENIGQAGKNQTQSGGGYKKPTDKNLLFQTNKGDVLVNNFYNNASFVDSEGNAEIVWNEDFAIHYLFQEKRFALYISTSNISEAQKKAENDLLRVLNIPKPDACKLGAFVFIDKEYDTQKLGRHPLSFCPN